MVVVGGVAGAVGVVTLVLSIAGLIGATLPIAFVALVPASAVSGALKTVLDAIAFLFPFKAALQAVSNALSATSPGIGLPLLHLAVLTLAFGGLAVLGMRRFASR